MAGRRVARWLAPLALVTCAVAVVAVVNASTRPDEKEAGPGASQGRDSTTTVSKKSSGKKGRRRYTVRAGETASAIAEKTGVPLERILELNPKVDPQTLAPGTKLKLRR